MNTISIELYDNGLLQKLKYWTEKTDIHVYNVEQARRLMQVIADSSNDSRISLPIISISRPNGFSINNSNKQPLSFDGLNIQETEVFGAALNAIPITIRYKIDVYTRYQYENDLYMRNLIFNFINYPGVTVKFKYNGYDVEHSSNLYLDNSVEVVSSDIKLFSDQICVQSLNVYIDDAYLWDVRVRSNVSISDGLKVAIKDNNDFIIEQIS